MTEIKTFKCGLCKEKDRIPMTRAVLKKHLRDNHFIMSEITNRRSADKDKIYKQSWWIEEKNNDNM